VGRGQAAYRQRQADKAAEAKAANRSAPPLAVACHEVHHRPTNQGSAQPNDDQQGNID